AVKLENKLPRLGAPLDQPKVGLRGGNFQWMNQSILPELRPGHQIEKRSRSGPAIFTNARNGTGVAGNVALDDGRRTRIGRGLAGRVFFDDGRLRTHPILIAETTW